MPTLSPTIARQAAAQAQVEMQMIHTVKPRGGADWAAHGAFQSKISPSLSLSLSSNQPSDLLALGSHIKH